MVMKQAIQAKESVNKDFTISKESINSKLLYLCGIFSTAPIISINVLGRSISLFRICFFVYMLLNIMFIMQGRQRLAFTTRLEKLLLLWLSLATGSCLLGLIYYNNSVPRMNNAIGCAFKTLTYVVFLLIFFTNKEKESYVLNGLLHGSIANLVWVIIDATYYYLKGASLTNQIFAAYIVNMNLAHKSIDAFEGSLIRPGGFNSDPASVGIFAPFVFAYGLFNRKLVFILLGIAGAIFSGSTTSAVCIVFAALVWAWKNFKMGNFFKMYAVRKKNIAVVMAVLMITSIGLIRGSTVIESRISGVLDRINRVYVSGEVENVRVIYVKDLPIAMMNQGVKVLTGSGFRTSFEGYRQPNISSSRVGSTVPITSVYADMENLYIAYFFDCGIIGFFFYLVILFRAYKNTYRFVKIRNKDGIIAFSCLLATIFSSIFYHYTLYSLHFLLFGAICVLLENRNDDVNYENLDCNFNI